LLALTPVVAKTEQKNRITPRGSPSAQQQCCTSKAKQQNATGLTTRSAALWPPASVCFNVFHSSTARLPNLRSASCNLKFRLCGFKVTAAPFRTTLANSGASRVWGLGLSTTLVQGELYSRELSLTGTLLSHSKSSCSITFPLEVVAQQKCIWLWSHLHLALSASYEQR